jgi:hypothetical protein
MRLVLPGARAVTPSPECGTIEGRTRFLVFYRVAGGIDMAEFESCCRLHEPSGFVILTDEAEVILRQIVKRPNADLRTG